MSKEEKKKIVIPPTELGQLKAIVNSALKRIISCNTKRTYQQELEFIGVTLQKYIKTTYITKIEHKKNLMEQVFGYINELKNLDSKMTKKDDVTKAQKEGINLSIKELEKNIYKNGRK